MDENKNNHPLQVYGTFQGRADDHLFWDDILVKNFEQWKNKRLPMIFHLYIIARNQSFSPIQFSSVPVHVVFHIQYLPKQ